MADRHSRAYSVRLSGSDLRKLKGVASRLAVTESDLIRFALRRSLARLSPLDDEDTQGASLLPVFVEFGAELTSYFDLDLARLEDVLMVKNGASKSVDREDIGLLLLAGLDETRFYVRLRELSNKRIDPKLGDGKKALRKYLYDKYLYSDDADAESINGTTESSIEAEV